MVESAASLTAPGVRWRSRLAPAGFAVLPPSLALTALAIQLAAGAEILANYLIVDVTLAMTSVLLGAFLISRVPQNLMGWLFALTGSAYALTAATTAWVTGALTWDWPGLAWAGWVSEWAYVLALGPQVTLLFLLFPDGRPPSHRWRPVAWVSVAAMVGLVVSFMLVPEVHTGENTLVASPLGGIAVGVGLAGPLFSLLAFCSLASAISLALRLWRADGPERRRIAPYVGTVVVVIAAFIALEQAPSTWEPIAQTLVLPLLPLAATVCIVRYRLYDVEFLIRRSLVWLGLTAVVVLGYALVVEATANLLRREAGLPESLIAAGAVAAAFQPTRLWLQRLVGRALYGYRDDPELALAALGPSLSATAEPGAALAAASRQIAASLALPWVVIEAHRAGTAPRRTEAGARPTWATDDLLITVPLVHAGSERGRLQVCRRSPKESLSTVDVATLHSLAHPIAATVTAFGLTDDLHRSRERIVIAREEERRRLRHDLHDDLAPLLASFTLRLDAAMLRESKTGTTPAGLLSDLRATADQAATTIRRSVEQLRPALLGELGIEVAIRELAGRLQTPDGPTIEIEIAWPLPALTAATEIAAHRIATEGVTNAVRHARSTLVHIRIHIADSSLIVEIYDNGRGITADDRQGVGTVSMRERAEEVGGRFEIAAAKPTGTLVRAVLPLEGAR